MPVIDGLPKARNPETISEQDIAAARLNNQFLLNGTDPEKSGKNMIVFLEYVQGTNFTVEDVNTNILTGTIPSLLDVSHAPMRLDGGVKLNGTILVAKGFIIYKNEMEV